ncbi:MAG: hypothetical protein PVJ92_00130 [Candidatus Dependentiae bacterium]|jgi:hypothetical protein
MLADRAAGDFATASNENLDSLLSAIEQTQRRRNRHAAIAAGLHSAHDAFNPNNTLENTGESLKAALLAANAAGAVAQRSVIPGRHRFLRMLLIIARGVMNGIRNTYSRTGNREDQYVWTMITNALRLIQTALETRGTQHTKARAMALAARVAALVLSIHSRTKLAQDVDFSAIEGVKNADLSEASRIKDNVELLQGAHKMPPTPYDHFTGYFRRRTLQQRHTKAVEDGWNAVTTALGKQTPAEDFYVYMGPTDIATATCSKKQSVTGQRDYAQRSLATLQIVPTNTAPQAFTDALTLFRTRTGNAITAYDEKIQELEALHAQQVAAEHQAVVDAAKEARVAVDAVLTTGTERESYRDVTDDELESAIATYNEYDPAQYPETTFKAYLTNGRRELAAVKHTREQAQALLEKPVLRPNDEAVKVADATIQEAAQYFNHNRILAKSAQEKLQALAESGSIMTNRAQLHQTTLAALAAKQKEWSEVATAFADLQQQYAKRFNDIATEKIAAAEKVLRDHGQTVDEGGPSAGGASGGPGFDGDAGAPPAVLAVPFDGDTTLAQYYNSYDRVLQVSRDLNLIKYLAEHYSLPATYNADTVTSHQSKLESLLRLIDERRFPLLPADLKIKHYATQWLTWRPAERADTLIPLANQLAVGHSQREAVRKLIEADIAQEVDRRVTNTTVTLLDDLNTIQIQGNGLMKKTTRANFAVNIEQIAGDIIAAQPVMNYALMPA